MRTGQTAVILLAFSLASVATAQTPTCDGLAADHKALAQEILSTQHPYDCCDRTILECLQLKPTCRLAWRLAENVCRRLAHRQDQAQIVRGLSRRGLFRREDFLRESSLKTLTPVVVRAVLLPPHPRSLSLMR